MRDAARARKLAQAEQIFASLKGTPEQTYDDVQLLIQDDLNVHRVVLAWRAWEVLDFIGKDHARDMLRQTVRFCSDPRHTEPAAAPHPDGAAQAARVAQAAVGQAGLEEGR